MKLLFILSAVSTTIPFLAGLLLLAYRNLSKDLKVLLTFLGVAALTELIVSTLSINQMPNHWLIHIYTLLEYVLVAFLLSLLQQNEKTEILIRQSIYLYLLAYLIIKISGLEDFSLDSLNYLTRPIALIALNGFVLYTLQQLWANTPMHMYRNSRFWVLAAMAIYYTAAVILVAFMYTKENRILYYLLILHSPINIIHNLLFTVGILCHYRFDEKGLVKTA